MYDIDKLGSTIDKVVIGRSGENLARKIQFDVSAWLEDWPDAAFTINVIRPDESVPYPAPCYLSGNTLIWEPDLADTALYGVGKLEIVATSGERIKKSAVVLSQVLQSLYADDIGDVPPVGEHWLDAIAKAQSYIEQAVIVIGKTEENVLQISSDFENSKADLEQRVATLEDWRNMGGGGEGGATPEAVQEAVNYYLEQHPVQATPIDATFTQEGQAADARAVGERLKALEESNNGGGGLSGITITVTEVAPDAT